MIDIDRKKPPRGHDTNKPRRISSLKPMTPRVSPNALRDVPET